MKYFFISLIIILAIPFTSIGGYKEDFEKEFLTKPWAGEQLEENVCIECHSSDKMKSEFRDIVGDWNASWHSQNKISCQNCHGGDSKDAVMSMSQQRGFVGTPKYDEVPEFCGKCHIGILRNYMESGHGKALRSSRKGPNCVTCHGSHNIQKASIDIINEQLCTKCHTYERAKTMKRALFLIEEKIGETEKALTRLKSEGIFAEEEEKTLFSTHAEFRTLFHTVDVSLVKERTDEFTKKLGFIEKKILNTIKELQFRKNFSAFIMMLFIGLSIAIFMLSETNKKK